MRRANVFITFLIIIISIGAIYYCLKIFRDGNKHTIRFTNTSEDILQGVKVYAMMQNSVIDTIDYENNPRRELVFGKELPDTIEYQNGWWYQNGKKAVLVYDGKNNYGLSRNYLNPLFFVTINDKYFVEFYNTDHPKGKKGVFDYNFTITPVTKHNKYDVWLDISHHGRTFRKIPAIWVRPLKGVTITGPINNEIAHTWDNELTKEERELMGFDY